MIPAKYLLAMSEWAAANCCSIEVKFDDGFKVNFKILWSAENGKLYEAQFAAFVPHLALFHCADTENTSWLSEVLEKLSADFQAAKRDAKQ